MKNREELDEETTIADMSFLERRRSFPRFRKEERSTDSEPLRGENLRAFITGTLSAALLIGLAYAAGLGLFVLILYLLFQAK
ncbi:MAG: hypothetical protein J6S49_00075 [Erysipelotrichaceae bacterium]|nr:hypothetical protein [Erysipelotrichaceae bacterium]